MQDCRQPTSPGKGSILLKDKDPDSKDRMAWKWRKGEETRLRDLGNPVGSTDYAVCIYHSSTAPQPVLQARAPAGGNCPGRPCWRLREGDGRCEYKNRDLTPDGLQSLVLHAGTEGKAQIKARGKKENLAMPELPLTPPVIVQAQARSRCWEATYSDFILKNQPDQFRAKPDALPPCETVESPLCNGYCPGGMQCKGDDCNTAILFVDFLVEQPPPYLSCAYRSRPAAPWSMRLRRKRLQ